MAITKVSPGLLDLDSGITISVADNSDNLTLTSTDADANSGPNLRMYRNSSSPADNDYIGEIQFEGRNDNSQDVVYAGFQGRVLDASDGTEDGRFELYTIRNGAQTSMMMTSASEIIFNNDSIDLDFRVESDGNANMLFVDGGNDVVCIGGTTVESGDHFEVLSSDSSTNVRIRNTNAGASSSSVIFDKASSSPADDDQIGLINFIGNDDTGNATVYAQIFSNSTDVSNGTEDGTLSIGTTRNGVYATRATFTGANLAFGHTSANAISSTAPTLSMNHPSSSTLTGGISYSANGTIKGYHYVENDFLLHQTASGVGQKFYNGSGIGLRLDTDGIKFGSDTAAANALDDYEEGTWTVAEKNGQGGTVTTNRANYTKIGRMVFASASVLVGTTTNNNILNFTLPFASTINGYYLGGGNVSYHEFPSAQSDNLRPNIENAAADVHFLYGDNSTPSLAVKCNEVSTKRIDFFVQYQVS
jgi:hypothetical protein|tara:strand:+ start:492 stop:1913 length:1422 start_codon:yes stop_codon:yes gene_type:complete